MQHAGNDALFRLQSEIGDEGDEDVSEHDRSKPMQNIAENVFRDMITGVPDLQVQAWIPIHNTRRWVDPSSGDVKFSAIILFPSGIAANNNDVHVLFETDVTVLTVQVRWPDMLNSTEILHIKWQSQETSVPLQAYHPREYGYKQLLYNKDTEPNGDRVSMAHIQLSCPTGSQLSETEMLGRNETADRYLYVSILVPKERKRTVSKLLSLILL